MSAESSSTYTGQLAAYAAGLEFADIPVDVVLKAKCLTLHVLSVSIAARDTTQGQQAIKLAQGMGSGSNGLASIWGEPLLYSPQQAAFANGTLADILDWEDCSWTGHPSAGAIPAALAVAESLQSSGEDYIRSVVAGYEVYQRVAMAVQPSHETYLKTGWGLTSWQIFAAAIPAAVLIGQDEKALRKTIGVASVMTPIVNRKIQLDRSDMYHYQHGLTARDGIAAAEIASAGINGLEDVLDGDHGYWVTISDKCDWHWMNYKLGEEFLTLKILIKRWPVNMWVQQFLDMVAELLSKHTFTSTQIDSIVVSPDFQKTKGASRMIFRPEGFRGTTDAQFSIPFCLASYLVDPIAGRNWFLPEKLKDPEILEIAAKVTAAGELTEPLEAFAKFQQGDYVEASIEIHLNDGQVFTATSARPKGHPENALTLDEVADIFRSNAIPVLGSDSVERIIEQVQQLESVEDMATIGQLLRPD